MGDEQSFTIEDVQHAAVTTCAALERVGVRYALIGGMATSLRSQPRFTKDVDFLLQIPQLTLPTLLKELEQSGYEIDELAVIREFTQHHMVVLSFQGIRVDWLKPVIPAYQHILDRATEEPWLGQRIRVASAEGLILMKMIAGRGQDWVDIENLVAAKGNDLDLAWIQEEWQTLADADDPRMLRLVDLVERVRQSTSADAPESKRQ